MKYLTKDNCKEVGQKHRWEYLRIVIKCLEIIKPKNSLELGGCNRNIVVGGDTMDKNSTMGPVYDWNALNIPWPIKKKQYDIFIALQVWEHLKGKQYKAFKEVPRIANWAILSFPYKWRGESFHCNINKEKISRWTRPHLPFLKPKVVRNKIIYIFNFFEDKSRYEKIKNKLELV